MKNKMKAILVALVLSCLASTLSAEVSATQTRVDLGAVISKDFISVPSVDHAASTMGSGTPFGGFGWEVIMGRVGLGGFEDRYPHQMSGGMRKRTMLAQTLIRDPDIILMDEPFSALDIQTRQLMENEVLELWMAKRKAVLFITHDLDEAIAMSDRVVVLSAGPGTHPIGEFPIDLPRPRDVAEVRMQPRFIELHAAIWAVLRDEVLKGYAQQKRA